VLAEHFLQKHQIGTGAAHGFAQFGQDEAAVEGGKALVCIDRQHLDSMHGRCCCRGGR